MDLMFEIFAPSSMIFLLYYIIAIKELSNDLKAFALPFVSFHVTKKTTLKI